MLSLTDNRAKKTPLPLADLLRQSVYRRLAGYENVNDVGRLPQRLVLAKIIELWPLTS